MDSPATESPLEVLSRAATMVQNSTYNTLPPSYDEARSYLKCKESNTNSTASSGGKWNSKREQRRSLKHTATSGSDAPGHNASILTNRVHLPEPLDMSITKKLRGSPPSYQQSVQYKKQSAAASALTGTLYRPSVITTVNTSNSSSSSDLSEGDGMCDPVVDEHFRRSLGKDYLSVFSANNFKTSATTNSDKQCDKSSDDAGSSLSVDDHFAKALGDTWLKLQRKDSVMQAENNKRKKDDSDSSASQSPRLQIIDTSSNDSDTASVSSVANTKMTCKENTSSNIVQSSLRYERRLL